MDKFKTAIVKALAVWSGLGTALIALGASGIINIPSSWLGLFSASFIEQVQVVFDLGIQTYGAILVVAQVIRGIFVAKQSEGQIKVLDTKQTKSLIRSPFKI